MAYIPLILAAVIVAWFVAAYNKLVRFRNQIKNAWHQIDVQLKRRYDLIPNLVEVVKDYMSYEQETLTRVIEARGAALTAKGPAAQAKAESVLTETLKSLFAVVENYPELKANRNVASLQEELTGTENKISFARQFYNDSVMTYNNAIQSIPTNFIASFFNFGQEAYFETESESRAVPMLLFTEAARHNVRMSFLLFALLFVVFFLLGTAIGGAYGDVGAGLGLSFVLYSILGATAYFSGSSIMLSIHGAQEAGEEAHRQLRNVVEEMAIAAGVPPPKVYVIPTEGLNAFAAGRRPEEASVAVTAGLLDRLSREELQGVIAHELAHIKSRDTLYNVCAAVLVGAIALLSDLFLRGTL